MSYENTHLTFLREDCAKEFGQEKGTIIYEKACERLASLLDEADFRNSECIKIHLTKNLLPTVAYYLTLLNEGCSKEEAYVYTQKETKKAAAIQKKKNEAFGKLPFAFQLFKLSVKPVMQKMYPVEGWDTEWIKHDSREIHMNFTKCIYLELTTLYGCPELCTVFCKNDEIVFAGYKPRIRFERSGTLAEGNTCCDFHFMRG